MKKISVLLAALLLLGFWGINLSGKKKSKQMLTMEQVENLNRKYIAWFNAGKVDSLLMMYGENSCTGVSFCGKEQIKMHFFAELGKGYKFEELNALSLHCSDTLAVETGSWRIRFEDNAELSGVYMTEWHYNGKGWYVANDIASY